MKVESPEILREWLTINLKKFDADPITLGTYILALVKKDKGKMDLKTVLLPKLKIFLQDETSTFVELLVQTLQRKSYITKPTVSDDVAMKLSTKPSSRCNDYDEKGYCVLGTNCVFDHGSDAIVTEHIPNKFMTRPANLCNSAFERDKYESTKLPLQLLPNSPPRIPPPTGELRGEMLSFKDKFMENSQYKEDNTCLKRLFDSEQTQMKRRYVISTLGPCPRKIPLLSKEHRSVYISNTPPHDVNKVFPKSIEATKKGTCERSSKPTRKESQQHRIAAQKIKLHQVKTQLVTKLITHQKLVLEKMMKTTNKTEKFLLKKTFDIISQNIEDLSKDLKKDNKELKNLLCGKCTTPQMAISKISAKALRQLNSSRAPKNAFRRNANSRSASLLSIDHRTKTILVAGIHQSTNKENLKKHFKHFGEIEKADETSSGIVISFYNRADAEAAFFNGTKFEDSNLSISWLTDKQLDASRHIPDSNEKTEQKTIEMISLEVEDEEEEEKDESRSWRHWQI